MTHVIFLFILIKIKNFSGINSGSLNKPKKIIEISITKVDVFF